MGKIKIPIAYSIYQICGDAKMIDLVIQEMPKITNQYELIDILYLLPGFNNERIKKLLNEFRNHKEYLVVYNATRALGLPTDEVVEKFRKRNKNI